jgi:ribosomal protein S18 acetylase RimI-like enzyme
LNDRADAHAVIEIAPERLEEAAETLTIAFQDYPLLRHFFQDRDDYEECLRAMFRLSCQWRLVLGWSLLGSLSGDRLAAVALVTGIESRPEPETLLEADIAFLEAIGEEAARRLEQYAEMKARYRTAEPHLYLTAIGTLPQMRGQGHARALLDRLHRISESHPTSAGVGLDTQIAANVALYERCGYRVIGTDSLSGVPMWFLFRPNRR